ncbi:archease [Flagellimonas lutaonensis]|uniref:Archease domain-containing protein n=1 Tax=Flagellimonas lutaonensis TaxID=516051 RepID=A0A0D5YQZ7_9FLAO|nr:archease [Allomuricauda lutaonensis]AKA34271.1 hypothetical protein VC82_599 [Allomuricauda lutaonensis]
MNVVQESRENGKKTTARARNRKRRGLYYGNPQKVYVKALPHTADVETKVYALTYKELFENNLRAMNNILKEGCGDAADHFDCLMRLDISSADPTNLLVDFLSEVLSLSYVQKALFCNIYFSELSNNRIEAQLYGKWIDGFDEEIKGVTYHEAYVKKNDDNIWESHIIFDI